MCTISISYLRRACIFNYKIHIFKENIMYLYTVNIKLNHFIRVFSLYFSILLFRFKFRKKIIIID
jgi:hypothetical protein